MLIGNPNVQVIRKREASYFGSTEFDPHQVPYTCSLIPDEAQISEFPKANPYVNQFLSHNFSASFKPLSKAFATLSIYSLQIFK